MSTTAPDMSETRMVFFAIAARVGWVLEIACECGRSSCAEVIALPWCVYEQAQTEPR